MEHWARATETAPVEVKTANKKESAAGLAVENGKLNLKRFNFLKLTEFLKKNTSSNSPGISSAG